MGNQIAYITSIYDHTNSQQEEIKYKRQLLQCSREQLQVEVQTQEHLEQMILEAQQHLQCLEQRKQTLESERNKVLEDIAAQKQAYDEKPVEEKDEEFERKFNNTYRFLNEDMVKMIDSITEKMFIYQSKIYNLQLKVDEMADIREQTAYNTDIVEEELDALEQRVSGVNIGSSTNQGLEGDIGADSQNMLLHLEGGPKDEEEKKKKKTRREKDNGFKCDPARVGLWHDLQISRGLSTWRNLGTVACIIFYVSYVNKDSQPAALQSTGQRMSV